MTCVLTLSDMARMLRPRPTDAHKGTMGHALLVAGSKGVAGCAVLAAEACLRSGLGKLTLCTPECNRMVVQLAVPEAVMHITEDDVQQDSLFTITNLSAFKAVGVGPGIGTDSLPMLQRLVQASAHKPVVADADALRILANNPHLANMLRGHAVLTPHGGEMAALAQGLLSNQHSGALAAQADMLARQYGVWVVQKGHPTQLHAPDGQVLICPRGNAGMATAGAGDVLTGIITGLLAQGYTLPQAVPLGVWIHATAGDRASESLGQEAMLARDIVSHMHEAWRELHECELTEI